MATSVRSLMPDTPSIDGSEDSWTFLDDVEPCAEVETILLADAVKPIGSSDGEYEEQDAMEADVGDGVSNKR